MPDAAGAGPGQAAGADDPATPAAEAPTTSPNFGVDPKAAAAAMRFGWALAEVRGRFDPWSPFRRTGSPGEPTLLLDAAHERSPTECQIEAVKVLAALDAAAHNPIALITISKDTMWKPSTAAAGATTSEMLLFVASRLIYAKTEEDLSPTLGVAAVNTEEETTSASAWWDRLQWFLWAWDEALQDHYASGDFGTASAYQLGRGLAEAYWALGPRDPDKAAVARRWRFLLGTARVDALSNLCRRLSPSAINKQTAPAIEASLGQWKAVAAEPEKYVEPVAALEGQARVWRDLLVIGASPLSLVDPARLEVVARDPRPILKAFRWELLVAVAGALALSLSLAFLSSSASTVITALSAVGITSSGLTGWAKSQIQGVSSRVGQAVDQSVVNDAVAQLPRKQGAQPASRRALWPWRRPPQEPARPA